MYVLFKKTYRQTKSKKKTKEEKQKTKEIKEEMEKENVIVNSICGKSNRI